MADGAACMRVCVCTRMCAFVCCLVAPKVELNGAFTLCFHRYPIRHLTLLLIEALDLQFSYANYFNNFKIAVPTSAFSSRCIPRMDAEGTQLEWALRFETGVVGVS